MNFKNIINFQLKTVSKDETIEISGITFSKIFYILVLVDDIDLLSLPPFEDSFFVFKELRKSVSGSGRYLLFTCVCGIADDAGWDYFDVFHEEHFIKWNFKINDDEFSYAFDKNEYIKEVFELEKKINSLLNELDLEPQVLVYPE